MNVLEKYASNCGVKIREPFVASSYFPLKDTPYIILDNRSKFEPNSYDLFGDVMPYIIPVLKRENIDIYSFEKNEKNIIEGAQPFVGLFKKQESYLIKNSKLVVACDNVTNYFASGLGVPSIGLYAAYPSQCTEPLWGDKHISIESHRDGNLPGYGVAETPKTINFIEPEKIANYIFKSLGLADRVNHETFYMGDHYAVKVVEVIPDFVPAGDFMKNRALNVRMDYHFDEQILIHWLQNRKINLLTDKPINLNLLKYFKNNIVQLTVNINESFTVDYLTQVKNIGINVEVFCEEESKLADYRFDFFDFDVNENMFKKKEDLDNNLCKLNESTKFLSGKILLSEGKKYSCYEAKKAKKELTPSAELVYDTSDFWKELDHYRLLNEL
jgi:hypothetical protein